MGVLNLGRKDKYGRQRRVEHRGRYLRASRTGGLALRAQAKAAGLTFTGNTTQGVRVSARPARNTQVALQNGRFVLRGRYGSGPFRLNLSKSGLSLSSRNALGSINWTNPRRSSAKVAGVQFRGKTAAYMQAVYGVFSLLVLCVRIVFLAGLLAVRLLMLVGSLLLRVGAAVPVWIREWRRRWRMARLGRRADRMDAAASWSGWGVDRWLAGLLLVVGAWGRGERAKDAAPGYAEALAGRERKIDLAAIADLLPATGEALDAWRPPDTGLADDLAVVVVFARQLCERLPAGKMAEILLDVDELVLEAGARTKLQNRMIEVFADAAGLRVVVDEAKSVSATEQSAQAATEIAGMIDINTADLGTLQTIPHVGAERARAIVALRPFERLSDLTAVDGIGPKTLAAIREHGVVCGGERSG